MVKQQKKRRPLLYRATFVTLLALMIGGKWYSYVAHADTPFDDFGSSLNSLMPGPINRIGCDMLKQRFGNIPIPPKGCSVGGRWA